ncbi:hypothetical protein SAMN04488096_103338 [Mesonia phycicola]|uniref:Uncharacterized protein n=2 Tax=Mesonia phycicola TaxID=579105 RepID=A0A1M6D7E0_9FLAO|nr:hypothetical protein SAMN04488096_103338 [Mesonia phycicola]
MVLSNKVKISLSWLFLTAFMLIKVAGLHSLTHQDDLKHTKTCMWCHLSGTDNNTLLLVSEAIFDLQEVVPQDITITNNNYNSLASEKTPVCLIYNKPPPFYTV